MQILVNPTQYAINCINVGVDRELLVEFLNGFGQKEWGEDVLKEYDRLKV